MQQYAAWASRGITMSRQTKLIDCERLQPADDVLLSIDPLDPVHSTLPQCCRLLGSRLALELSAFHRSQARHFGLWLQERIKAGLSPSGPVEDAIRLEMAIHDVITAERSGDDADGRRRIVLLRYDPDELLDAAISAEQLQPIASGVAVQIDTAGGQLSIRRIDDRFGGNIM